MLDLKVAGLTLADYMFGKVLYAFYPVKLSHCVSQKKIKFVWNARMSIDFKGGLWSRPAQRRPRDCLQALQKGRLCKVPDWPFCRVWIDSYIYFDILNMKNKTIFMQGDRMHLHVGNHPNGSTCSVRLCKCIQSSLLKVFFIIWAFHFLFLEEVVNLSKADMSHCQMLGKVEYGLPAKIWRLVGCTEMLSW